MKLPSLQSVLKMLLLYCRGGGSSPFFSLVPANTLIHRNLGKPPSARSLSNGFNYKVKIHGGFGAAKSCPAGRNPTGNDSHKFTIIYKEILRSVHDCSARIYIYIPRPLLRNLPYDDKTQKALLFTVRRIFWFIDTTVKSQPHPTTAWPFPFPFTTLDPFVRFYLIPFTDWLDCPPVARTYSLISAT